MDEMEAVKQKLGRVGSDVQSMKSTLVVHEERWERQREMNDSIVTALKEQTESLHKLDMTAAKMAGSTRLLIFLLPFAVALAGVIAAFVK